MERLCLLSLVALFWGNSSCFAKVSVELEQQPVAIQGADYAARVEPDGCLTKLSIQRVEFLAAGVGISRGGYFYQNGVLRLPEVTPPADDVVEARGEQAAVRYEFGDETITCQLENTSDADMVYFLVLNGIVGAASVGDQPLQEMPLNGEYSEASFYAGNAKLNVSGFSKLWGPWQGPHQVIETGLKPAEKKTLTLHIGDTSPAERMQILKLKALPPQPPLVVTSPRDYQVVQRQTKQDGTVLVSGHSREPLSLVEVRVSGKKLADGLQTWQAVESLPGGRQFRSELTLPAGGWYQLEVRAKSEEGEALETTVEHFGIGEVFVGAGQSNSTNSGQFKTTQSSGMVSSFSGTHWQLADDPQPGVADRSQGGSYYPAFGDKLYEMLGVPIGVAATGYGGTSVNQWQPDGDLFQRWMLRRIAQLGPRGFRAVLWHQGESDVELPSEEYYQKLKNTIVSSVQQAGWEFPWFIAIASYHNPEKLKFENVRSAQQRLCDEGYALLGPDTDTLTGDHRDFDGKGIHFSPKGLKAHGEMWAEILANYIESALEKE